eukprot:9490629-Pyramimonas_sp.AAC.1
MMSPSLLGSQLLDTCSALSWQQASLHCMGKRIRGGLDFTATRRNVGKLEKDGGGRRRPGSRGTLPRLAAGPSLGLVAAGSRQLSDGFCPGCGASLETPEH